MIQQQYESALRIAEFKQQMAEYDGRTGNDIKAGLEIKGDKASQPKPTEQVDRWLRRMATAPRVDRAVGGDGVGGRHVGDRGSRRAPGAGGGRVRHGRRGAPQRVLNVATTAPDRYAAFLESVAQNYDDEYAQQVHFAASNVLAQHAADTQAFGFMDEMRQSEMANVADAQEALQRASPPTKTLSATSPAAS